MAQGYEQQLERLTSVEEVVDHPATVLRGNLLPLMDGTTSVPQVVGEVAVRYGFVDPEKRADFNVFVGAIYDSVEGQFGVTTFSDEELARRTPLITGIGLLAEAEFDQHNNLYRGLMLRALWFGYWLGRRAEDVDRYIHETEDDAEDQQTPAVPAATEATGLQEAV